jgi:hypothetical protein
MKSQEVTSACQSVGFQSSSMAFHDRRRDIRHRKSIKTAICCNSVSQLKKASQFSNGVISVVVIPIISDLVLQW